jgi:hypothetical protein
MPKIITRIKGGLGNQLFCYAAARRLAQVNKAELVIDNLTGFVRDLQYNRQYALDNFKIPCRKATPAERLEPLERYRRGVIKWFSRRRPFAERCYIEQEKNDFDERLLNVKVRGCLYLEGYWQSERYFKDIEDIVRKDLQIIPPIDTSNRKMADRISSCNAVAVHFRFFDNPDESNRTHNLAAGYYKRATDKILKSVTNPHFFLFSDNPSAARQMMSLPEDKVTYVDHNRESENAFADLWLMTLCRHFIIANSTFSWWGAWLCNKKEKIIISPNIEIRGKTAWGFKGLIPDNWIKL